MSLPPLPGMGATTKEENYDKITAWANAVGALALNALPLRGALGTADLNTITVPGAYRQPTAATATTERNYPAPTQGGILEVLPMDAGNTQLLQRWTSIDGVTGFPRGNSIRRLYGGEWSNWQFMGTRRIDTKVGRAFYSWDHVANREQLEPVSDSGIFDVSGLLVNGWTGTVMVQRNGYDVTFHIGALTPPAPFVSVNFLPNIPGFTPTPPTGMASRGRLDTTANPAVSYRTLYSGGFLSVSGASATTPPLYGTFESKTTSNWPTVAPGPSVGTIPNL